MKKPIAITAVVLALAAAGTAVAAPGGGIFGGSQDERQKEFASDLASHLDGVDASEVEQGLAEVQADQKAEMLGQRAEDLAANLDGVTVEQATAALKAVDETLQTGDRPQPGQIEKILAKELGVTEKQLEKAHQAEELGHVDQAVKDGMLTEKQAARIRKDIKSGKGPDGRSGHGHPGGPMGPPGGEMGPPGGEFGPGMEPGPPPA